MINKREQIEKWAMADSFEPPLIIVGPADQSEAMAAQAARRIVCAHGNGCGTCQPCRQASAFIHPDIVRVTNDEDLITDHTISVKAIRALLIRLSRTALSGRQLIIIPQAERLPADATNALLKTLEEPAATTRILMTTQFPLRLLPTLRSRSRIIYTGPGAATPAVSDTALGELIDTHTKGALSPEELHILASALETWLHQQPASPPLARAFLRLRDYYKIQSSRGNLALAADVLVASVAYVRNTIK